MCLHDSAQQISTVLSKMKMRYAGAVGATESYNGFAYIADPTGYRTFKILIGWRYHRASQRCDRQQVIDVPSTGYVSTIRHIDVAIDSFKTPRSAC